MDILKTILDSSIQMKILGLWVIAAVSMILRYLFVDGPLVSKLFTAIPLFIALGGLYLNNKMGNNSWMVVILTTVAFFPFYFIDGLGFIDIE